MTHRIEALKSWLKDQKTRAIEFLYTESENSEIARQALQMLPSSIDFRQKLDTSDLLLTKDEMNLLPQADAKCSNCGKGAEYFQYQTSGKVRCTYCGQYDCVKFDKDAKKVLSHFGNGGLTQRLLAAAK
jgi:DNA-directed RNA polymerase subunit RPC12/RpoP